MEEEKYPKYITFTLQE